jgi:hypothetical protein
VLAPAQTVVTEKELEGTATTIGAVIEIPSTKLWLELPPVGKTAALADSGATVTATGKLFVFRKAQKFCWSFRCGVIVTAVEEVLETLIAVVGPLKRKTVVFDMIFPLKTPLL